MTDGLEALTAMEYPGRFIILGRDMSGENLVAVYGITGRSPPSQARKISYSPDRIGLLVEPTDNSIVNEGNRDLLIYSALVVPTPRVPLLVTNGSHTETIFSSLLDGESQIDSLKWGLSKMSYEPDAPHHTPRIAGILEENEATLTMLRRARDGSKEHHFFQFQPQSGLGKLLSTYSGANMNPLPSFTGEPRDIGINYSNPEQMSSAVYQSLEPLQGMTDYRVSIASVFYNTKTRENSVSIINRSEARP